MAGSVLKRPFSLENSGFARKETPLWKAIPEGRFNSAYLFAVQAERRGLEISTEAFGHHQPVTHPPRAARGRRGVSRSLALNRRERILGLGINYSVSCCARLSVCVANLPSIPDLC